MYIPQAISLDRQRNSSPKIENTVILWVLWNTKADVFIYLFRSPFSMQSVPYN